MSKRSSNHIDREQAFVKALITASFIYTFARNCSSLESCNCDIDFYLSGCSHINRNDKKHNKFSRDPETFANFHNIRAGEIVSYAFISYLINPKNLNFQALKNSLRKLCRCHGVSGSCALQTCWQSISDFSAITSEVRKMYDNSVLLRLDNIGNVDGKSVREDQLVYLVGEIVNVFVCLRQTRLTFLS